MANEFVARNGVIAKDDSIITGSLIVTAGITGSLFGTSSWAQNSLTASYFVTSSVTSASYATSASNSNLFDGLDSLTFARTGSNTFIGNQIISGSVTITGSLTITGSVNASRFTGSLFGTASSAITASYAVSASYSPLALATKTNTVLSSSFTGNPKKATITFTSSFADTNYSVLVTGQDLRSWTIESKAAGSFIINSNSNVNLSSTTYWFAIEYGEA